MTKTSYTFLDLFSGCGGLSYGLEKAGHQCLLGVDFQPDAIETFKHNHPHSETYCGDIKKLDSKKLYSLVGDHPVDMVVGGPPCQGFSTVGKGLIYDARNSLFQEFVRIVKLASPKIIIMENVTGLLAKKNQFTLRKIFQSFESLGFTMDARVLSSEEYGVPERRRRTVIMGVKNGVPVFPSITHGPRGKNDCLTVGEIFKNLKDKNGVIHNHDVKSAQIKNKLDANRLKHIPDGKGIRYHEDEEKYLPRSLHYDVNWNKMDEGRFRQTKLQRLFSKAPSPTILTSRTCYYHPKENRYLTAREAAACQSFPNDFVFKGSLTSQFKQIGNAVPPGLAYALGKAIKQCFAEKSKESKKEKNYFERAFHYKSHTAI